MKRTERHHLKEDELQGGLTWFVNFYETWRKEIAIGACVVVVAALVFAGLLLIRSHSRTVQSRAIGQVLELSQGLETTPANLARLEALAKSGPSARPACLELATYWAGQGNYAKAETWLALVPSSPKDLLYYQAEDLKGQVFVKKGEFDKAIALYKKVQEEKPKAYPLDVVLFHLGEAYELKGQKKEALDAYTKLQAEYGQTYFGYTAAVKAGRLGLQK